MTTNQHTLQQQVQAQGVGLHSGKPVLMTLKPARPNTGITFVRTDLDGASVKASIEAVDFKQLQLATTLRDGEAMVQTTEHLMSAFYAMGVDNAIVELDGPEVPIMDGSAAPFLVLLEEAGLKRQAAARKVLKVTKPFSFKMGEKWIEAKPAEGFDINYEIDFDHPLIRRQQKSLKIDGQLYENQIAPARTFGFLKDINYLKSIGLVQGGSLDNAVVLDGDRMLNDSLRLKDEFVSHKILDMVGDFAIAGGRIQGSFTAYKAGHEAHANFLRELIASDACEWVTETAPERHAVPALQEQLAGAA